jgi:hypothetical protein
MSDVICFRLGVPGRSWHFVNMTKRGLPPYIPRAVNMDAVAHMIGQNIITIERSYVLLAYLDATAVTIGLLSNRALPSHMKPLSEARGERD